MLTLFPYVGIVLFTLYIRVGCTYRVSFLGLAHFICLLVTKGTLEEKIYQRQISKYGLSTILNEPMTNSGDSVQFSPEELKVCVNISMICDTCGMTLIIFLCRICFLSLRVQVVRLMIFLTATVRMYVHHHFTCSHSHAAATEGIKKCSGQINKSPISNHEIKIRYVSAKLIIGCKFSKISKVVF